MTQMGSSKCRHRYKYVTLIAGHRQANKHLNDSRQNSHVCCNQTSEIGNFNSFSYREATKIPLDSGVNLGVTKPPEMRIIIKTCYWKMECKDKHWRINNSNRADLVVLWRIAYNKTSTLDQGR